MNPFDEICELAPKLNPRAFASRLAYWRRGSLPAGGLSERVGGSRGHKLPAFDRTDAQINQAEADYNESLDGYMESMGRGDYPTALRHLRRAEVLERVWLVPIAELDDESLELLAGAVSDASSCNTCGITKEAWLKAQRQKGRKRSLWRLRGGSCQACYMEKYRARKAVLDIIDPDVMAS